MSDLGLTVFKENAANFTDNEMELKHSYSEESARAIDQEVKKILDNCYQEAKNLIQNQIDIFEKITQTLLEKEVIFSEEFEKFFQ